MYGDLDKYTLYAIRANDIYPTLSRVINPTITTTLSKTKDFGALANMAKIIKNVRSIIEIPNLKFLAANIGIDPYAFNHYLRELESIDLIKVVGNKVENIVPATSLDMFEALGNKLQNDLKSEEEQQHFELLNSVAEIPAKIIDLRRNLDLSQKKVELFKKIGEGCGYLQSYISPCDGKEVLFSPIYWEENPEKLFQLVDKYEYDQVLNSITSIRNNQGKPLSSIHQDRILTEAISIGCLPTNSVKSIAGEHYFAFTPNLGVKKYEKDIIKKARQIVACVRYGQHFGTITRIQNVSLVLKKLLRENYIGDHSENIYQYGILIDMGIVFPVKAHYGHEIHLNDTPENRRIFEISLELLENGTIIDNDPMVSQKNLKKVFTSREKSFSDELLVINDFKKQIPNDSDALQRIGDILRGVDEDVFK